MAKRIITISREFGSGGRFIGEEVAKKLGIAYYDKDIIGRIAEQSGFAPEYIQENAELSPKKGLFAYALAGRDITGRSVEDMVHEAQRKVILELAEKAPCVIIGRNADYILKDTQDINLLRVFIYAPDEVRVSNVMKELKVDEEKAKELIRENDQMLHARYKQMTGSNRGARHNRHMLIDSSVLGVEGTAEYIEEFVKKYLAKEAGAHGE